MLRITALAAAFFLSACGDDTSSKEAPSAKLADEIIETDVKESEQRYMVSSEDAASLNAIAESLVKLSLAAGQHDPAFVDAYHGPEDWAEAARTEKRPLELLEADARGLLISIERANGDAPTIRGAMLEKLTRAALTRIRMVRGETFSFDEETQLLYDAVAPEYDIAAFDAILEKIDALLPGDAPLNERVDAFRNTLAIPGDKLDQVFDAAIAECRRRTFTHYDLPANESFSTEFVTEKPWSGYNWYQGDYHSLIQVNTDFPVIIDRAVDLGCHEGYPGHHTWNVMLERDLLKGQGWIEYAVYPLFSPLSVTAEGSANYGIELAFPGREKIEFERDVLFPLAGLDPAMAEKLEALNDLRRELSHARNMVARRYLDGDIDRETAIEMMMKYRLESRERAEQSVRFVETYRGYVLNYNLGRDIVAGYVARNAAGAGGEWEAFEVLLTTPLSASDLSVQ
ncbi:hypothetical protein [Hyphococcus sp.]|uniref:hypothetical protein n=1 Tax=Hyphococcus sp. TaxID=2038636 RepID=UPI003CCBD4FC